jgi:hypothetical protein
LDGGLFLVHESDERLGLEKFTEQNLSDSRQGTNKQFTLADLLRQSVYNFTQMYRLNAGLLVTMVLILQVRMLIR